MRGHWIVRFWVRRVVRAARGVLIGALVAAAAAVAIAYVLAARSLPDYSETRELAGLSAPVEILRDARAVPHIFAETPGDAYFALGYVHAQDRLWQMEMRRRLVQGRTSELAGPMLAWAAWLADVAPLRAALLRIDVTARALDLQGAAESSLAVLGPEAVAALEAYAAGVNAYLAAVDADARGRGAPELQALGAVVEPWRPVDSVAAFKLLAATMSTSFFDEIRRARFLIDQGGARVEDLFPAAYGPGFLAPDGYAESLGAAPDSFGRSTGDAFAWLALAGAAPFVIDGGLAEMGAASNVWAAAGERSATRAPLLATDPHLALSAPSIWHVARLSFGDDAEAGDAIGATVPGVPAVLIGRNERVAWGFAAMGADVADVYIERVHPDDPDAYLSPGGWVPFERRSIEIPLGDGSAVTVDVRATRHGPVLPIDWPQVAAITPRGHVAALAWTVLDPSDRSIEAALGLMRSPSLDDALALRPLALAPVLNLAIADSDGVALLGVGRPPLRRPDSETRGLTPSAGWREQNDWVGFTPIDALPMVRDPETGLVANANNRVPAGAFPRHLSFDWSAPYRIQRLVRLLNAREYHTLDGFRAIQIDAVSEMARAVAPLMAEPLWASLDDERGLRLSALTRLASWRGDMDPLRAEPLIFTAWARALVRRLAEDDLGDLFAEFEGVRPLFLERVLRDVDGAAERWCDDGRTETATETCADMASLALDDALDELTALYGGDLEAWRWGRAHEAVHAHAPFGAAAALAPLFNIRQETGGGAYTLLRGRFDGSGDAPYRNVHGGGFRAVFDLADPDRSVFVIATGQSGHFLSRHYDDFAPLWRVGEYAPLSLARADAEAGAVGLSRLTPAE